MRDPLLTELLSRRGAVTRIAEACGISTAAVSQWKRVPKRRVEVVAAALGVPVNRLRIEVPDGGYDDPARDAA